MANFLSLFSFCLAVSLAPTPAFAQEDFWQTFNNPYGGAIHQIVSSPGGDLYAATSDGLFRFSGFLKQWLPTELDESVLEIAWNKANIPFAVSQPSPFFPVNTILTQKTSPEPWTDIGPVDIEIYSIAVNPENHLFIGTSEGVFKTVDGIKWESDNAGFDQLNARDFAVTPEGIVFAATRSGVFARDGTTNTWQPAGLQGLEIRCLAVDTAGQLLGGVNNGIRRSTDLGATWIALENGLTPIAVNSIAAGPGSLMAAGTLAGLYVSTDRGQRWAAANLKLLQITSAAIDTSGHLFAGSPEGIYWSPDTGRTWGQINRGLKPPQVNTLAIDSGGTIFAGTENGLFTSNDAGRSWHENGLSGVEIHEFQIGIADDAVALTWSHGMYRSSDRGRIWIRIRDDANMNGLLLIGGDTILTGSAEPGSILRSTNRGESWQSIQVAPAYVYDIAQTSTGKLLAGTSGKGILFSNDGGTNWQPSSMKNVVVQNLATAADGTIFAGVSESGIFRSTDDGNTWTALGLAYHSIQALVVRPDGSVFVGTDKGFFHSEDGGDSWQQSDSGLKTEEILCLTVGPKGHLYAGTDTGLFRSTRPVETRIDEDETNNDN